MNKEVKKLARQLRAAGCEVIRSGGQHYKVFKEGRYVGTLPSSPSDSRSLKNTISDLRKNGVVLR